MNALAQVTRILNFGKQQAATQLVAPVRELRTAGLSPDEVARAFAVGTAVSFVPVPATDLLLAGLLTTRFRLNKAAVMIALALWNDAVVLPFYAPGLKLGQTLVSTLVQLPAEPVGVQRVALVGLQFAVGNGLLAAVVATAVYLAVRGGMSGYRLRSGRGGMPRLRTWPTLPRLSWSGIFRSAAG